MAKRVDSSVLDAALNTIKNGAIRMTVCTTEPTAYGDIASRTLATATVTSAELTVGAGTGQGRRLTTPLKTAVAVTATGDAQHIALHNNSNLLYYVTTCSLQAVTNGGTLNIPAWTIDIAAPT